MFEEISEFDNPRQSLEEFLLQVKRLLVAIAFEEYLARFQSPEGEGLRFEGEDLALYQNALHEYMDSREFERLLLLVSEIPSYVLEAHGLQGQQLLLKRHGVRRNEQRFLARPGGRIFRKFFQTIDVLLDSILAAVPAGTALSELKDFAGLLPDDE